VLPTKVSQFQFSSIVDEEILWFEVSVKNPTLVTVLQPTQELKEEKLQTNRNCHVQNRRPSSLFHTIFHTRMLHH
jgi:hypothetical protein